MSEKRTYHVTFKEKNSFELFQNTPTAATIQPLYLMPHSNTKPYELTAEEAILLKNNPYVKAVEPTKDWHWAKPGTDWTQTGRWNRGDVNLTATGPGANANTLNKNWALWRCFSGENQPASSNQYWGYSGFNPTTERTEFSTLTTGTLDVSASGKYVDIVICDSGHVAPHMFELQKNADGTGGSRVIEYNWNQHWAEIIGVPGSTKPPTDYSSTTWGDHGTLCATHAAGNTQGWARDANVYTFSYQYDWDDLVPSPMSYIAAFHRNKPVNPVTGRKNPTIVNNSWSYRFGDPWAWITEIWDQGGTRLNTGRPADEHMTNYSPCVVHPLPYVDPQSTGNGATARPALIPLRNKLLDAPGELARFAKYEITTTNDLSGVKLLTTPAGWQQISFSPKPYYREVSKRTSTTELNAGKSFVVQAPCCIDLFMTITGFNNDLSAKCKTEIKIYRGSTLIKTVTGDLATSSYAYANEVFEDSNQYTITYKPVDVSGYVVDYSESGSFRITNEDFTCVKTANYHGDAEDIPADGTISTIQVPFDFQWKFFEYPVYRTDNLHHGFTVADEHGIKFNISQSEWTGATWTPRILFGRTSWADVNPMGSGPRPWAKYYTEELTGEVGSRILKINTRFQVDSEYAVQDWGGAKYFQAIYTIYENRPNYLEVEIGQNTAYIAKAGSYGWTTFRDLGWITDQATIEYTAVLDDYQHGIDQGVITCGAAGNNSNMVSVASNGSIHDDYARIVIPQYGIDDYTLVAPTVSPGGAGDADSIICGAVENSSYERIAYFSSRGPGVSIFAPGTAMFGGSYVNTGLQDPRSTPSNTQYLMLGTGTSFAAPTVCGMMALIAEQFPHFTQKEMKAYLVNSAGKNQINQTSVSYYDTDKWGTYKLRNSQNNYLRYREERQKTGTILPAVKRNVRPNSGVLFPRRRGGKK